MPCEKKRKILKRLKGLKRLKRLMLTRLKDQKDYHRINATNEIGRENKNELHLCNPAHVLDVLREGIEAHLRLALELCDNWRVGVLRR
jgi:hypothetical protein